MIIDRADPEEENPFCFLCKCAIPEPVKDYYCSGCGQFICGDHLGDPWGQHEPEDHDE